MGQVQGDIIYCEGETSTNLSTGVANGDYVLRHPEADMMLLSAYAKVRASKYTGLELRGHRCVCSSSLHLTASQTAYCFRGDRF